MINKLTAILNKDWDNFTLSSDCMTHNHSTKNLSFCTKSGHDHVTIDGQVFKLTPQDRNTLHNTIATLTRESQAKEIADSNAYLSNMLDSL